MSESEPDTSRALVQTYVPAYQREEWDAHAKQLEMSRSEFVRTMVQAGRRGFGAREEPANGASETRANETGGGGLEEQVREQLQEEPLTWEELLEAVAGDIEERLEEVLQAMQAADELHHSGREGGYVLENDE